MPQMINDILDSDGNYAVSYSEEDGKRYIGNHQHFDTFIKRRRHLRDIEATTTKSSNPNEWRHVGTVPITLVVGWCRANGYTFDQWARDEDNAKQKFCKYFFSREFSKLHNEHVTTRRESSKVSVPARYQQAESGLIVPR